MKNLFPTFSHWYSSTINHLFKAYNHFFTDKEFQALLKKHNNLKTNYGELEQNFQKTTNVKESLAKRVETLELELRTTQKELGELHGKLNNASDITKEDLEEIIEELNKKTRDAKDWENKALDLDKYHNETIQAATEEMISQFFNIFTKAPTFSLNLKFGSDAKIGKTSYTSKNVMGRIYLKAHEAIESFIVEDDRKRFKLFLKRGLNHDENTKITDTFTIKPKHYLGEDKKPYPCSLTLYSFIFPSDKTLENYTRINIQQQSEIGILQVSDPHIDQWLKTRTKNQERNLSDLVKKQMRIQSRSKITLNDTILDSFNCREEMLRYIQKHSRRIKQISLTDINKTDLTHLQTYLARIKNVLSSSKDGDNLGVEVYGNSLESFIPKEFTYVHSNF